MDADNWNAYCVRTGGSVYLPGQHGRIFCLGTLFSALDLGRAGLQVAQVQLDVAGNNIANANKPGYSRQRVELTTRVPNFLPFGALGRGPAISGVLRIREDFLDVVYRQQLKGLGNAEVQANYFTRMEDIFQEPGENGFSARFNQFFDALNDFANGVESLPGREALLAEGEAVTGALRGAAGRINTLRTTANEEIRNLVPQVNALTSQISQLNRTIRDIELNGTRANDIRDDRDLAIDELAKLVNISYREQDNGQVEVLLGGDVLISGTRVRELKVEPVSTIDPTRGDLLEIRYVDSDTKANINSGTVYGVLNARDVELVALADQLDEIARGFIEGINNIHTQSNGLDNYTSAVSSTNMTLVAGTALTQLSPPFSISDGSFQFLTYDSSGNVLETITVPIVASGPIGGQTTGQDLVNAFNTSANLTASIGADGRLTITPAAGTSVSFANDTSGVMTALGINGFFEGTDASTIRMNSVLLENPRLIGSGYSTNPLETGDNRAALDMAGIRTAKLLEGGSQSIPEYYQALIARLGISTRTNSERLSVEQNFVNQFEARRQEVSGVSLDEEVTNLIQFQRAFEASARVITIADRMLETLLNVVR